MLRDRLQKNAQAAAFHLHADQQGKKPLQAGQAREQVLIGFLMNTAHLCGAMVQKPSSINANGEIPVFGQKKPNSEAVEPYGEAFAAVLGLIPRRTGASPSTAPVLPENGWCYINHFDVERLLKGLANGSLLDKLDIR